jgi:hypothetical protein
VARSRAAIFRSAWIDPFPRRHCRHEARTMAIFKADDVHEECYQERHSRKPPAEA